jgi:cell surface protein SprA
VVSGGNIITICVRTRDVIGTDPNNATFDISVVNIEENGKRTPINYVIPPGILQESILDPQYITTIE